MNDNVYGSGAGGGGVVLEIWLQVILTENSMTIQMVQIAASYLRNWSRYHSL